MKEHTIAGVRYWTAPWESGAQRKEDAWWYVDPRDGVTYRSGADDLHDRLAKAEEVLREYARIYLSITGSRAREYFEEVESEDVDTAAPDSDDSAR